MVVQNVETMVPLKYLNNFWRTFGELNLILKLVRKTCVIY